MSEEDSHLEEAKTKKLYQKAVEEYYDGTIGFDEMKEYLYDLSLYIHEVEVIEKAR